MIKKELLDILVCPADKTPLTVADAEVISSLNKKIESGEITNKGGKKVTDTMDGGLIREDGAVLYPIRGEIPIMLQDEGIAL